MDETLCDTRYADEHAQMDFAHWLEVEYPTLSEPKEFAKKYIKGVYKKLNKFYPEAVALLPDENAFRLKILSKLFKESGIEVSDSELNIAQNYFNHARMQGFRFFPGVEAMLKELRAHYKLVVITNGSSFSQRPKLKAVKMTQWVDHILIGGEQPEEKPSPSIFQTALNLVDLTADQVLHVGDSLEADIKGANDSGIFSVLIQADEIANNTGIEANHQLEKVIQLPSLLAQLK